MSKFSISQNFLTSRKIIERLINKTNISDTDTVLEIGAGKGHITHALASRCNSVVSYEIDPKLYGSLKPKLADNVKLYCADFLDFPLPKGPYKVFANIPFSRTTEILRKLTSAQNLAEGIWLVMEKGAAKRFCGLPRENLSSLLLKPFFEVKIVYHFSRDDFHPAPGVDTVLIELKQKQCFDIAAHERSSFTAFVAHGQKYGLFGRNALLTKRQIATALRLADLPQIERSGDILYVQWLCLFRCWHK